MIRFGMRLATLPPTPEVLYLFLSSRHLVEPSGTAPDRLHGRYRTVMMPTRDIRSALQAEFNRTTLTLLLVGHRAILMQDRRMHTVLRKTLAQPQVLVQWDK